MADKYVATDGDNGGAGSSIDPWLTAVYGFTNVGASNTLKFLTGTYDIDRSSVYTPITNGTSGNPTIITDNGDGVVVFNHPGSGFSGLLFFTGRTPSAQYISFIGTAAKQIIFDLEDQNVGACIYVGNTPATDVSFVNCEVRNGYGAGILGGSAINLLIDNCDIHDNGQLQTQDHGVYASGQGLIISNSSIYDNIAWGIHCYDENYTGRKFYNNRIWGNGGDGILISRGGGTIYNNVIFDNAQHGISLWRTVDTTVYHNSIYSNDWWGISDGTDGRIAIRSLIKGNIAIGNVLGDCKTFSTSANAVIQWNTFGTSSITSLSPSDTVSDNEFSAAAADEWTDPTNATPASKDFTLKSGAVSIEPSGMPSLGITEDITGTSRPQGSVVDKGAYEFGSDPPDGPGITHDPTYIVTTEYGDVAVTLVKGTNNIVECTLQGTGAAALCVDNTDVTVVRVT